MSLTKQAVNILLTAICFTAIVVFMSNCNSDSTTEENLSNGLIGPDGGTVSEPGGASLVVPAGALSEDTEITIVTYTGGNDLPVGNSPFPRFTGGVNLSPDGLQFQTPATLTIPLNESFTPGDTIPLYVYDFDDDIWMATEFDGAVNADGESFDVDITHFSLFGSFSGGLFGGFHDNFDGGANAEAAFWDYVDWFHTNVCYLNKKGSYENECQEAIGIFFDFTYNVVNYPDGPNYQGDIPYHEGTQNDNLVSFGTSYDLNIPNQTHVQYTLAADVYVECTASDMETDVDPSCIEVGETSTVTATLTCGEDAMSGMSVTFETAGGLGTLSQSSATTGGDGSAQTVFTAEEEGQEAILIEHTACNGQETASSGPTIQIGNDWTGTCNMTFNHSGQDVAWVFSDNVTINFNLTIEDDVISGTGSGSHSVDVQLVDAGDCSVQSITAPAFTVEVSGNVVGDYFEFQIIPTALPLVFTIFCDDPPITIPVPAYSNIEASIMGNNMFMSVASENGAADSDSGSEGFGDDQPVDWSFSVTLNNGG